MRAGLWVFCAYLCLVWSNGFAETPASPGEEPAAAPTHKQVRTLKPHHDGQHCQLWSFCLDKGGNIWAAVTAQSGSFTGIQVYDPQGTLEAEYPLSFQATAVNFAPDGTFFVAGEGRMAKLSSTGEILKEGNTPNIQNFDEFKAEVLKAVEEEAQQATKQYQDQIDRIAKQMEAIETREGDDNEEFRKAQLDALKLRKEQYEQILASLSRRTSENVNPDELVRSRLRVTGIAASSQDVFVCCHSASGRGYDVWRCTYDFQDPKRVIRGLSGCCGNMDIQVQGDDVVTAENGRFRVATYNRDGKMMKSWGKRDRTAPDGFGSCCNPMNVQCLSNGEILAAESSVGNIKRFDSEGNFLGIVGKAKIAGGCKHVAIGFDSERDRYYMQHEDAGHICVLVSLKEAPELTEDEKLAKEAREGLGAKLVGVWKTSKSKNTDKEKPPVKATPAKPRVAPAARARLAMAARARGNANQGDVTIEFKEDGTLRIVTDQPRPPDEDRLIQWDPVRQADNHFEFSLVVDGVETQVVKVDFDGDDRIRVTGHSYYLPVGDRVLERVKSESAEPTISPMESAENK